jgi:hypothetical protein
VHSWSRGSDVAGTRASERNVRCASRRGVKRISPPPACIDNASAGVLTPVLRGVEPCRVFNDSAQAGPSRQGYSKRSGRSERPGYVGLVRRSQLRTRQGPAQPGRECARLRTGPSPRAVVNGPRTLRSPRALMAVDRPAGLPLPEMFAFPSPSSFCSQGCRNSFPAYGPGS